MSLSLGILFIFIAGFFQGLTSFGFALISIPFLVRIIPITEAVPIVVICRNFKFVNQFNRNI